MVLVSFSFLEEANSIYQTAMESFYYLNLYCTQGLNLASICSHSEGSRKYEKDTLWLQGGKTLLFGKSENMFSAPRLKNDQVEEPDLAEPRNCDVFSHSSELLTSKLSAKMSTKIIEPLDLSNLEPKWNYELKGYNEEVCINHSNGGPEIENAESIFINVPNCRNCILNMLKTCWDSKTNKYSNIFLAIADFSSLLYSYYKSSKPRDSILMGGNLSIIEGSSLGKIRRLQRKLVKESWRPGTKKIVLLKKTGLIERRVITIGRSQDNIVAISIQQILEFIYEGSFYKTASGDFVYTNHKPIFLGNSHGFRPHRGCHTAMVAVKRMSTVDWLLKEEIEKCFNKINQKRLLNIIEEYIGDQKLKNILNKFFKASVRCFKLCGFNSQSGAGLNKESPFSSILFNIFLHKLDLYVNDLKKEVVMGKSFNMHENEAHCNLIRVSEKNMNGAVIKKTKKYNTKSLMWDEPYRHQINDVPRLRLVSSIRFKAGQNRNKAIHSKMNWVRYADNFLIGIWGSIALANYIRDKICKYLKFKLLLETKQSSTVCFVRSKDMFFLGYEIKFLRKQEERVTRARRELSFKKLRNQRLVKHQGLYDKYNRVLKRQIRAAKHYKIQKFYGRKTDFTGKLLRKGVIRELEIYVDYLKKISDKKNLINPSDGFQEWKKWVNNFWKKNLDFLYARPTYNRSIDAFNLNVGKSKTVLPETPMLNKAVENYGTSHKKNRIKYNQPFRPSLIINAPIGVIQTCLRSWMMLGKKTATPRAVSTIFDYHVVAIIQYFTNKAKGILNYYCICKNFWKVKQLVNYQMRWSLIHTLAGKYKSKVHRIVSKFGKTPQVLIRDKNENIRRICSFLTPEEVQHMPVKKIVGIRFEDIELTFKTPIHRLSVPKVIYQNCAIINCSETQVKLHHLKKLACCFGENDDAHSAKTKIGWAKIQRVVQSTFTRKQIPLCAKHHNAWCRREIDPRFDVNMACLAQDVVFPGKIKE